MPHIIYRRNGGLFVLIMERCCIPALTDGSIAGLL